ncbi:MAG: hypothetical protein WCD51_14820 [Anaerolineae bacterium]
MPWIAMTLVTLLALVGIFLATVAGILVLVAAIVIVARKKRRKAVPAVEPAD